MNRKDFINPTCDKTVDAVRFLSLLDLTPVLALLEGFYCEPWRHRHPPEAILRLVALYKLKRLRFLTELWRLLDDETLRLLGFRWRPSYKTVWHWLNRRLGPEGLEVLRAALMKAISEANGCLHQGSERRRQRVNQPSRSHIRTNKNSKKRASLLADALLLKNDDETSLKIERH
jgi:hypothetical protein